MFKVFATDAVISKGYDNTSALKFSDNGESVRFRIGKKVYDSRADNNTRWVNISVKAFGPLCERIKKMQLKEGSYVHLSGRLDEESWVDADNKNRSQSIIILEDIEYASGGGNKTAKDKQETAQDAGQTTSAPENSPNFEGYSAFDGGSFFDA